MRKLLLLSCLFAAMSSHAADDGGNYAVWGLGRSSCHQFLRSAEVTDTGGGPTRKAYRTYVMGYLTAFNTVQDDTYSAIGAQTLADVFKWLEGHCENHQMDSFDHAVQELLRANYDKRHRVPPGHSQGWGRTGTNPGAAETSAP